MQNLLEFINNVLNPIGIVVGLLMSIPVFALFYDRFFGRARLHGKWMKEATGNTAHLPAVLIIDLLAGKDILAVVKRFMAGNEKLKDITDERIIKIDYDNDLTPKDMPDLARKIQDAAGEVLRHGADELHVFIAGPVCAAAMVGAELSNISCKVLLYQNDRAASTYVNFGPLRHPRF